MKSIQVINSALAASVLLVAPVLHAQVQDSIGVDPGNTYLGQAQAWVQGAMTQVSPIYADGRPFRMEVSFGTLDSRLRLAPCNKVEPYLPVGTKLWGKSRVGLRCLDGAVKWNVFLPVTVKAYGKAWILNSNIPSGTLLRSADAVEAEVDLAEENSPILADSTQWIGSTASRQLVSGQAIRQSSIRASTVFSAGSPVRVVAQGSGFSISTDGQVLTAGAIGQSVKVKMESGRIVTGLVIDQNTVRIDM